MITKFVDDKLIKWTYNKQKKNKNWDYLGNILYLFFCFDCSHILGAIFRNLKISSHILGAIFRNLKILRREDNWTLENEWWNGSFLKLSNCPFNMVYFLIIFCKQTSFFPNISLSKAAPYSIVNLIIIYKYWISNSTYSFSDILPIFKKIGPQFWDPIR